MRYLLQKSRLQHLVSKRNGYLTLAVGSFVLNVVLVLVISAVAGTERIIVVPPSIDQTFWVSAHQVSRAYLSEMSLYFADLRFNLTASNVAFQHDRLLRSVDPKSYGVIKAQLLSEAEQLTKEHIAMSFYPVGVPDVDAKKLVSIITADIQSTVGDSLLPLKRGVYRLTFVYRGGRLLVKSFEEIKKGS